MFSKQKQKMKIFDISLKINRSSIQLSREKLIVMSVFPDCKIRIWERSENIEKNIGLGENTSVQRNTSYHYSMQVNFALFVILIHNLIMLFLVPRPSSRNSVPTTAASTSGAARTWNCPSRPGCAGARWRSCRAPTWDTSSERGRPTSGARGSTCSRGTPSVCRRQVPLTILCLAFYDMYEICNFLHLYHSVKICVAFCLIHDNSINYQILIFDLPGQ